MTEPRFIEIPGDDLYEYSALAMCNCEAGPTSSAFLNPELSVAGRDIIADTARLLEGLLAFAPEDQDKYVETLSHLPVSMLFEPPRRVLVLGGLDGLVAAEFAKLGEIESITVVDERAALADTIQSAAGLRHASDDRIRDRRIEFIAAKAEDFIAKTDVTYDVIVFDLICTNLLENTEFYAQANRVLNKGGVIAVQSTFPLGEGEKFTAPIREAFNGARLHTQLAKFELPSAGGDGVGRVLIARHEDDKSVSRQEWGCTNWVPNTRFAGRFQSALHWSDD